MFRDLRYGWESLKITWRCTLTFQTLLSQFRCNGSDGYLAWIDQILQVRETANETLEGLNYDFRVIDDPQIIHNKIIDQNKLDNNSRMLAGYCWDWISKVYFDRKDIVIGDYKATWNLSSHGQGWLAHPESVTEVGCIHTCQGLDLSYAGVIIGEDLIVRNGKVVTNGFKRAKTDKSLFGFKKMYKENKDKAIEIADIIIKNTYRTLLTRGMKGCYVFCVDKETQEYFKSKLNNVSSGIGNLFGSSFSVIQDK